MQTQSTDLFPETLLVTREGERIYTTTRSVAFHFGKLHKDVLRALKKTIVELDDEEFSGRNFAPANYLDDQKKPRLEYQLTHDGFLLLTMGFTGRKATRWRKIFIDAFNQKEAERVWWRERYLAVLDQIRPNLRPTVEAFEAGLPRIVTAQQLGKSVAAISYHRSQARRFGLLSAQARGQA